MRRTIYVILGLISVCFVFAQQTISESVKSKILTLPEFEIKEQKLIVVLDKVIADEEKCPYYSDSVCFVLNIEKNNVIINSINNIRSLPSYRGYFYHQNRFFFVVSRTFPDSLFKITKQVCSFPEKCTTLAIDDSFSQWIYYYKAGSFTLLGYQHCNGEFIEIVSLRGL